MVVSVWNRGRRGWFLRYPTPSGRRKARKVGPPGEIGAARARQLADEANQHAAEDKWHPLRGDPLPVATAVRAWRDQQGALRSERTRITDHGLVEHIANHFGDAVDMRQLSNTRVREFASKLIEAGREKKRSGSVVANAVSILRRVVNLAVGDGLLDRNPVTEWAKIIREARQKSAREIKRRDAWSIDETTTILSLAAKYEPRIYPVLLTAFHTGMRRGELLGLRWEDVDTRLGRFDVRRAAAARGGTKIPKASKARMAPLSKPLAVVLEKHQKTQRRGRLRGRTAAGWVFPAPEKGRPWEEHNFSRSWRRLRRKHFADAKVRPLPFHCTRHTFITRCLENGTPTKVVAEWVGATATVIEQHYAHVIPTAWAVDFLSAPSVEWNQTGYRRATISRKRRIRALNGDPERI